jgi:MYXO-CTERM domain-containing protein
MPWWGTWCRGSDDVIEAKNNDLERIIVDDRGQSTYRKSGGAGVIVRIRVETCSILAFVVANGMLPNAARAYRTFADSPDVGVAASQVGTPISIELVTTSATSQDLNAFESAIVSAAATWSDPSCSGVDIRFAGRTTTPANREDGRNSVTLVYSGWAASGFPAGRAATTDVRIRSAGPTADIAEADIYVNLDDFEFGDEADGLLDRQGVLTHEVGHLLGILHPCENSVAGVPECSIDDAAHRSTMYPEYIGASGRNLSADDVAAVCALYPENGCPLSCGIGMACERDACVPCANQDCSIACPGPRCEDNSCSADTPCAEGTCAREGEAAGTCVPLGSEGASCIAADDCETSLCLTQLVSGFCTRACGSNDDCTVNQFCARVDHRMVCEPQPTAAGCSIARPANHDGAGRVPLFAMLLAILAGHWRRRRS